MTAITKTTAPHFLYGMVATFSRFAETLGSQVSMIENHTEKAFAQVKRIEKEKLLKLDELSLSAASGKKWGSISSITQDVLSVGSLAFGAYSLKEKGAEPSTLLALAAGATSLANRALKGTGAYDRFSSWVNGSDSPQEKIASSLETGMSWFSRGLSVAGGVAAFGAGAVQGVAQTAINVVSNLSGGLFGMQEASINKDASDIRASLQEKNASIAFLLQDTSHSGKDAERLAHTIGDVSETMKTIAETLNTKD